ncbi:hypothetical protein [Paenibacillus sp. N3.4]|uniref:hypothetical protein n=1 Tax=Paenibacillus sp. N3.4 TaxID=2603222 RepID=UPI0011C70C68|nr:hypothetical protein [Paenibacillus sp. N3.4]TXK85021.1 hypothetical protein FU659_05835 [Paenibacillus sp. N3.4]
MKDIMIKFILFVLFLFVLMWILDYFKGQWIVQAFLLVILSFVYSIIESKVIVHIHTVVQHLTKRKR